MRAAYPNLAVRPVRAAFTLLELVVAMTIIIIVLGAAVPMFNVIRGNRSVEVAYNTMSAELAGVRATAIGLNRPYGVLLFLNPQGGVVSLTPVAATNRPQTGDNPNIDYWLDVPASAEIVLLPRGVMLQLLSVVPFNNGTRTTDGYIGYNDSPGNVKYGGVILFDGQGRPISARYAFRGNSTKIGALLNLAGDFIPPGNPLSQRGFTLVDAEPFKNFGFTESDAIADGRAYNQGSPTDERAEEEWLDLNGMAVLIRPQDGRLMKGE
jgi:hypothetical protein